MQAACLDNGTGSNLAAELVYLLSQLLVGLAGLGSILACSGSLSCKLMERVFKESI